jgi:hypothetical protein
LGATEMEQWIVKLALGQFIAIWYWEASITTPLLIVTLYWILLFCLSYAPLTSAANLSSLITKSDKSISFTPLISINA